MKRILRYPAEFTTLPDYTEHNGQVVEIIRPLVDGEEYDREEGDEMFLVSASDGWEGNVYQNELEEIA